MFKKKAIYIILLVIFSLLLCADVLLGALPVAGAQGGMSGKPNMQFNTSESSTDEAASSALTADEAAESDASSSQATSNADGSMPEMPDFSSNGSMPEMPSNADGSMPEMPDFSSNGSMPEMPSNADGTMPEMPDFSNGSFNPQYANGNIGQGFGFLFAVKSYWIPIAVFCVLVDAFCVFMLIRISKKKKQKAEEAPVEEEAEPEETKKKKKKLWIIPLCAAGAVVIALTVISWVKSASTAESSLNVETQVIEKKAENGDITESIISGGSLEESDSDDIALAGSVKIKEYAVENGDFVEAGQLIATVDKNSVMLSITEVQNMIKELDEALEESSSDKIASTISAPTSGRVKAVYADKGDSVANVMYEHGALMLVSLDGCMAADIPAAEGLSAGTSVEVVLSDGTVLDGKTASVTDGVAVVTVSDETAEPGEAVTVRDEDGNTLGSAELYIHSELKITGFSGTVSSSAVEVNDEISAGETLFKLTDTSFSGGHDTLLNSRRKLEKQMKALFEVYQTGGIYAQSSGEISNLNDDLVELSAASTSSGEALLLGADLSASNGLVLLSNSPTGEDDSNLVNYAATVTAVSYGSIQIKRSENPIGEVDYTDLSQIDTSTLTQPMSITSLNGIAIYRYNEGAWISQTASDISAGDTLVFTYNQNGDLVWIVRSASSGDNPGGGGPGGGPGGGGGGGGDFPGGGGFPTDYSEASKTVAAFVSSVIQTDETEETEEEYEVAETTVCGIIPHNTMSIETEIDELDILRLSVGQTVVVTLDALSGRSFEGVITEISKDGSNDGGNTKYTVTVTVERTDEMLSGMNASLRFEVGGVEKVVVLPVEALAETSEGTGVYLSYDEKNDELGGFTLVETGLSDGETVEITSGIKEGDTVFYKYAEKIKYTFVK